MPSSSSSSRSRSRSPSRSRKRRRRSRSRSPYSHRRRRDRRRRRRSRSSNYERRRSRSRSKSTESEKQSRSSSISSSSISAAAKRDLNKRVTQMALEKAAVGSSEKLLTSSGADLTFEEQMKRSEAIDQIESGSFSSMPFVSSKSLRNTSATSASAAHDAAIFTPSSIENLPKMDFSTLDPASFVHPSLFVSYEEKLPRWKAFLKNYILTHPECFTAKQRVDLG